MILYLATKWMSPNLSASYPHQRPAGQLPKKTCSKKPTVTFNCSLDIALLNNLCMICCDNM